MSGNIDALMQELKSLKRRVNQVVRQGAINVSNDNSTEAPIIDTVGIGKTVNKKTNVVSPYGLYINLPDNIPCLLFSMGGHAENQHALGFSFSKRFKDKLNEKGTVLVGNPETGSYVLFDKDGKIEIFGGDELNITINNDKDVNIKAKNVKIDADKTELGVGGNEIARKGDSVTVTLPGSVTPGTPTQYPGTITGGGTNTSI